jgi:hypothetical protein
MEKKEEKQKLTKLIPMDIFVARNAQTRQTNKLF